MFPLDTVTLATNDSQCIIWGLCLLPGQKVSFSNLCTFYFILVLVLFVLHVSSTPLD